MKIVQNEPYFCHDCGKKLKAVEGKFADGVSLAYESNGEKIKIAKCDACFNKSFALTNFQPCEIYSMVVGYLRPVSQWNVGKRREYKEGREYAEGEGFSANMVMSEMIINYFFSRRQCSPPIAAAA